jgi:hypothetical protein
VFAPQVPSTDSGRPSSTQSEAESVSSGPSELNGGEDAEEEPVELPPPMKPIADPLMGGATALAGPNSSDDALTKRVSLALAQQKNNLLFATGAGSSGGAHSAFLVNRPMNMLVILQASSLSLKALDGASADLAEIEQIVKERMVGSPSSSA